MNLVSGDFHEFLQVFSAIADYCPNTPAETFLMHDHFIRSNSNEAVQSEDRKFVNLPLWSPRRGRVTLEKRGLATRKPVDDFFPYASFALEENRPNKLHFSCPPQPYVE